MEQYAIFQDPMCQNRVKQIPYGELCRSSGRRRKTTVLRPYSDTQINTGPTMDTTYEKQPQTDADASARSASDATRCQATLQRPPTNCASSPRLRPAISRDNSARCCAAKGSILRAWPASGKQRDAGKLGRIPTRYASSVVTRRPLDSATAPDRPSGSRDKKLKILLGTPKKSCRIMSLPQEFPIELSPGRASGQETGFVPACQAIGISRARFYRSTSAADERAIPTPCPRGQVKCAALTSAQQEQILAELNSERFLDCSPRQVWATLLDEEEYLCSWRQMYRLLHRNQAVRETSQDRGDIPVCAPGVSGERPQPGVDLGHHLSRKARFEVSSTTYMWSSTSQPIGGGLAAGRSGVRGVGAAAAGAKLSQTRVCSRVNSPSTPIGARR